MRSGFQKGDIILPITKVKRRQMLDGMFHAAVIWQEDDYDGVSDFLGLVLTHNNRHPDNLGLISSHIREGYEFKYEDTHFINQLFVKLSSWGEFIKVGELTEEGILFIDQNLTNTEITDFISYFKKSKKLFEK